MTALDTPGMAHVAACRQALVDVAPFAVSVVPFGLAVGAASAAADLTPATALFGGVVLLAGAAQLAAVESIGRGDSVLVVALLVALVNLRFVLYGAGMASWFAGLPKRRRLLLAFPVVDQTFLLCQQRFAAVADLGWRQRYFAVSTAVLAGTFVGAQVIAVTVGTHLPASAGLHLAAPLAFVGLLTRAAQDRRGIGAAIVAAAAVVVGAPVLGFAALPAAVALGVAAAVGPAVGTARHGVVAMSEEAS